MPASSRVAPAQASRHRHRPEFGMPVQSPVQRAKEGPSTSGEMLPRVFPVQNDGEQRFSPAGSRRVSSPGFDQTSHEVVGGDLGIPAGIRKADQVRQHVVAERARHAGAPSPDDVRHVEEFGLLGVPAIVARKADPERPCQDLLVGGHPPEACGGDQRDDRVRHRPFRGPQAGRPGPEQPRVTRRSPLELLARRLRGGGTAAAAGAHPGASADRRRYRTATGGSGDRTARPTARPGPGPPRRGIRGSLCSGSRARPRAARPCRLREKSRPLASSARTRASASR